MKELKESLSVKRDDPMVQQMREVKELVKHVTKAEESADDLT